MKKDTLYFLNTLSTSTGNYILHYFFEPDNFSGNRYIYNNSYYSNYTGEYIGHDLLSNLNLNSGALFFNKESSLNINLENFSTNRFSCIIDYEKLNKNSSILFSCINTGSDGKYYGFNVGVGAYNNLLIEYYDTGNDLRYLSPGFNIDTKGFIVIKGFDNYLYLNYYNVAIEDFSTESFTTNRNLGNNISREIILGSGKFSNLSNYEGYFKNFVLIKDCLENNQLKEILKQFIYTPIRNYTFSKNFESYTYKNYPNNETTKFDNYINSTGFFNEFGEDFLDNNGVIYGSITGTNYNLDLTGIKIYPDSTAVFNSLTSIKNNIKKIEFFDSGNQTNLILLNNGKITGSGDNTYGKLYGNPNYVGDWANSPVGLLSNIIDLKCKNRSCLALSSNGTITGWGDNQYGKVYGTTGYNDSNNLFTGNFVNTPLYNLNSVKNINLGNNHAVFVKNDNTLLSWGKNDHGQVAGINDRSLGYPLFLKITGVYSNWQFLLNKRLDFTGFANGKPSYKYLNDFENLNLTLNYNNQNNNWVFNYGRINQSISLNENTNYPQNINSTNGVPYQVEILDSFLTEVNGVYFLETGSKTYYHENYNQQIGLDNFNQPILNLFNIKLDTGVFSNKWSIFNGGQNVAYVGTGSDINFLPLNSWSGVSNQISNIGVSNGFFDQISVFKMNLNFGYGFNTDVNNIFVGNWNETPISELKNIQKISVGDNFNIALLNNSGVTGWGKNDYQQASGGNNLTGVIDIAAGSNHSLAILKENNTLTGWGYDYNGVSISAILNLTGIKSIDATNNTSFYVDNNNYLQGTGIDQLSPSLNDIRLYNASENGIYVQYITGTNQANFVTGNAYFVFNKNIEKPTVKQETITVIYERISGYENRIIFSGVTGYDNIYLTEIPDYNNSGFGVYLVSGKQGVIYGDVLTGVQILSYNQQIEKVVYGNETYQESFSRPITDTQRTGNFIYEFNFNSRAPYFIDCTEALYLDKSNYKTASKSLFNKNIALTSNKSSNLKYSKTVNLDKNIQNLSGYGADILAINEKLDQNDIIEIYSFNLSKDFNIKIDEALTLSRVSNNFRFGANGANYVLFYNGISQFTGEDYTLLDATLAAPINDYEGTDILEGNFIKNQQYYIGYTGQSYELLSPKDFVYLNGQKLISGYHYNFDNSNINFNNVNIPVTGLVYCFDSLFSYNRYTGNSNYYNIPRFNKKSNLIWLNGIKLKYDSFYEISQNDSYNISDFYEKNKDIIYNNTRDFLNI